MLSRLIHACLIALLCGGCAATRPAGSPPMSADAANGQAIVTDARHAVLRPVQGDDLSGQCRSRGAVDGSTGTDRSARAGEEQAAMYAGLGRNCYGSYALEPI